jgi:hypothetical protein
MNGSAITAATALAIFLLAMNGPPVDAQTPVAGVEEARRATALARERLSDGDIKGAESAAESAIEIQERELGADDLEVATSLARAAMLHVAANDLDGAKTLYERALAIRESRLGPDSVGVARILDDLARVHAGYAEDPNPTAASHLHDAYALLQRSLAIREKALGPEHPDVAIGLYNLALNYTWRTLGASGERPLFLRALAIREKAFGDESAPVVDSLLRLARYDEAVGLTQRINGRAETMANAAQSRERALQTQEKLYGGESPELVDNLTALAELHVNRNVDEKSEAGPLLDRALTIAEKTFGPADFWRALQIEGITEFYRGRPPTEAEKSLSKRALAVAERGLSAFECAGKSEKRDFSALIQLYDDQDRLDGVETLGGGLLDGLASRNERSGRRLCESSVWTGLVAHQYDSIGEYESAERVLKFALAAQESNFGDANVQVLPAIDSLASFYESRDRASEAESLRRRAIGIFEAAHDETGRPNIGWRTPYYQQVDALTHLLLSTDRASEAEALNRRALQIEESLGESDQGFLVDRLNKLAEVDLVVKRDAEAEALLVRASTVPSRMPPDWPDQVGMLQLDKLAAFYESRGRAAEAYTIDRRSLEIALQPFLGPKGGPYGRLNLERLHKFANLCLQQADAEIVIRRQDPANQGAAIQLEKDTTKAVALLSDLVDVCDLQIDSRAWSLVAVDWRLGRDDDAKGAVQQLIPILEKRAGADDPVVASALVVVADILYDHGSNAEADPMRERAMAIMDRARKAEGSSDQKAP